MKLLRVNLTNDEQELVNATAETYLRYYSELYYEQPVNKAYLQGIQGNIDEWVKERKLKYEVLNAALIQTLCMTIANMCDQGDVD